MIFFAAMLFGIVFVLSSLPPPSVSEHRLMDKLQLCLWHNNTPRSQPRANVSTIHYPFAPYIELPGLLDSEDVSHIRSLAHCMETLQPESHEVRSFSEDDDDNNEYNIGNTCTYLSSYMIRLLPELTDHLLTVIDTATNLTGWRPSPLTLGLRTLEFIQYDAGKKLNLHKDDQSVYTLIIMLSNPQTDFTGADFFLEPRLEGSGNPNNNESLITLRPSQFSGLLFDSLALHGLGAVTSGHREVFALELWDYPTEISGYRSPAPEGFPLPRRTLHTTKIMVNDKRDCKGF